MWALLVYAACAAQICSAQIPWFVDSYEGSACKTPSGAPGVCKEIDECLVTLPNPVPVSEDSNGRALCGSVGPSALVCCDSRAGDVTHTTTTSSPSVVTTTGPPRAPVGAKSAQYCLSIIPFNKQPWWIDDSFVSNDIEPWWEEAEEDTVPKENKLFVNGGVQTFHREFPHMALLGYLAPGHEDISWNCAGSLISDRFVLTATHCFTDTKLKAPIVVRLGEYDLTANDRTEQNFGIEKTWLHPTDKPGTWYHDLALVRLDREVRFSGAIRPACLYSIPEDLEKKEGLVITGWGSSAGDDSRSLVLMKGSAKLSVVPRNECAKYYRMAKKQLPYGIHPGMVCAVDRTRYVDTCKGDSGGPIQLPTTFDVYVIVGVVTGGPPHCGDENPRIYTRVAYYLDWIENIVWPNGVE